MKSSFVVFSVLAIMAGASEVSPIEKIVQMISDLQAKVIAEGEDAQKVYDEYAEWCEDRSTKLGFEIKTGKAEVAELKATIEEETSSIGAEETKIEELSSDIQTDEADLAAATKIREKEAADFAAEEKELNTVINMLERATSILSKEMAKSGGAAMLQMKSASSLTDALSVMVEASVLSSADASRLTALVQTTDSDSDSAMGAPAAAVYEGFARVARQAGPVLYVYLFAATKLYVVLMAMRFLALLFGLIALCTAERPQPPKIVPKVVSAKANGNLLASTRQSTSKTSNGFITHAVACEDCLKTCYTICYASKCGGKAGGCDFTPGKHADGTPNHDDDFLWWCDMHADDSLPPAQAPEPEDRCPGEAATLPTETLLKSR